MPTICQVCGDRGFACALNYCSICRVNAQHRYCFLTLPKVMHKEAFWVCNICASANNVTETPVKDSAKVDEDVPIDGAKVDVPVDVKGGKRMRVKDSAKVDEDVPIDGAKVDVPVDVKGGKRMRVKHSAPRHPYKLPRKKKEESV